MSKYLISFNEDSMYDKLKATAKKEKRSIRNTILLAIENYLNQKEETKKCSSGLQKN